MNLQSEISTQADAANCSPVAPWRTPGPEKEAWKDQGNLCDYREMKASRPADLAISISGPRSFSVV